MTRLFRWRCHRPRQSVVGHEAAQGRRRHRRRDHPGLWPKSWKRLTRRPSAALALTEILVAAPARMHHVVGATADHHAVPGVDQVEHQRRLHADGGVQSRGRLPGPVAHPGDVFALAPGIAQRHPAAVAGQHVAAVGEALDLDLQALHRGIHVARGAEAGRLLAQHVPGLDRPAQLDADALDLYLP